MKQIFLFSLLFSSSLLYAQTPLETIDYQDLQNIFGGHNHCSLYVYDQKNNKKKTYPDVFLFQTQGVCYFIAANVGAIDLRNYNFLPIDLGQGKLKILLSHKDNPDVNIYGLFSGKRKINRISELLLDGNDLVMFRSDEMFSQPALIGTNKKKVKLEYAKTLGTYFTPQGHLRIFNFKILESDCWYLSNLNPNATKKCIELETAKGSMEKIEVSNKFSEVRVVLNDEQKVLAYEVQENTHYAGPMISFIDRNILQPTAYFLMMVFYPGGCIPALF